MTEGKNVTRERFDENRGLGFLKKKSHQNMTKKRDGRGRPTSSSRKNDDNGPSRRGSSFAGIPVMRQTVIAVIICCLVLVGAGLALFTVEQKEISALKSDLKAYTADGVVSASVANDAINLSVEAVSARVATLTTALNNATDGTMSNSDLQWFGSELTAVKKEAETLGTTLDAAQVDSDVEDTYTNDIKEPLVSIESAYAELGVSDDDVASTDLGDDGAATDTGSFKSATGITGILKWVVIILAVIIVAAALIIIFRKKFGNFFRRLFAKLGIKKEPGVKKPKKGSLWSRGKAAIRSVDAEEVEARTPETTAEPLNEGDPQEKQKRSFAFEEPLKETPPNAGPAAKVVDPLDKLAPSFRKMAELEKAIAAAETQTPTVSPKSTSAVAEEDLMAFDETIAHQSEIDENEDDLFTKGEKE